MIFLEVHTCQIAIRTKPLLSPYHLCLKRILSESLGMASKSIKKAYAPLIDSGMAATSEQSPERTLFRLKSGESFLGFLNSEIVGTITIMKDDNLEPIPWFKKPGVFWFQQFAIRPGFQGKGLGGELLSFAESFALTEGANELALDTAEVAKSLVEWYRSRGYRFIEYCQLPGVSYHSIVLSKKLHIAVSAVD